MYDQAVFCQIQKAKGQFNNANFISFTDDCDGVFFLWDCSLMQSKISIIVADGPDAEIQLFST